jgi:hypothetical protein
MVCSDSDRTSEAMNPFRHFNRMKDRPITRPLPIHDTTTQGNDYIVLDAP